MGTRLIRSVLVVYEDGVVPTLDQKASGKAYILSVLGAVATMYLDGAVMLVMLTVLMHIFQCINADSKGISYSEVAQRTDRSSGTERFMLGPDGLNFVLTDKFDPNKLYEHVDEYGSCCCGLCNPGQYMETFCTCSPFSSDLVPQQKTKCKGVNFGTEFMNLPNNSTVPYTCTEHCKANQTQTSDCTSNADITCECNEGWFNPSDSDDGNIPKECRKIPGCKAGEEPIRQVSDDVVAYICQQCQPGYFKSEGNCTKPCKPHRACQITTGTLTSDVKCLNDVLSDGTQASPSTTLLMTQGTHLPHVFNTVQRPDEMMTTSSSTPRAKDPPPTSEKPEPTGKSVNQFGFKTAFIIAVIVILILILVIVVLCLKPRCNATGGVLPTVGYLEVKVNN